MIFNKLFIPRSIGQRFALAIGAGAAVILIVLSLAIYLNARELLLEQTSRLALREAHDEIGNWDDLMDRIAMLPMAIGTTQTAPGNSAGVTIPWLAHLLEQCPIKAVYGLYMILDNQDWKTTGTFLFVDRKSWPQAQRLSYDFHDPMHDWYSGAKSRKGTYVTQPFFAEGGSEIEMISITQAVYDAPGKFLGVAGADISLEEMRKSVREMHMRDFGTDLFGQEELLEAIKLRKSSYMISPTGAVMIGPKEYKPGRAPSPGEKNPDLVLGGLWKNGLIISSDHLATILAKESGSIHLTEGNERIVCWAQSRTTGWKILLVIPYKLIVGPARHLAITSMLIGGLGLIVLIVIVFVIGRRVSAPIRELQRVAAHFEQGVFKEHAGILQRIAKRADELGKFAMSFLAMVKEIRLREERLHEWNLNLENTVKARTSDLADAMKAVEKTNAAMAAELAQAAAYARAVLPDKLRGRVTTDWVFETSSQLGGDSFGYHWLDDDHLAIYLLDVCGHGVGAALLSVSVVNLLRTTSLTGTDFLDPAAVLASLNETFPMERHGEMYFTAWYGVYTSRTRELCFACGGHPPAVLVTKEGAATCLSAKGVIVGAFPQAAYQNEKVFVPDWARLYLFSDGVYEIEQPGRPMMSYDDFVEILKNLPPDSELASLVAELKQRQGGDCFVDDISLIEFRFLPPTPTVRESLVLNNNMDEWGELLEFTREFTSRHGLPHEELVILDVILEEVVTNILKYGGMPPDARACSIELMLNGAFLEIKISDSGTPFNPLLLPEVDTDKRIEERPIGGLGIHILKKLTISQHYEYHDGRNVLTLVKQLKS
jgi:serine phosphatase RsbU (regulator of sigma subunit)/anti-sigma regulatory factor (Ser/Thr protein kinase)